MSEVPATTRVDLLWAMVREGSDRAIDISIFLLMVKAFFFWTENPHRKRQQPQNGDLTTY
jgi:hypothetical protein